MNMDIVGPLPTSLKGKIYFLVKGDYMKKYIIAAPMPDQTAETVIQTFIDSIVVENGVPERVLTDQGSNFLSRTIDDLYRQFGIERLRTTTYIPCCD
jgi:transposase InsO family protein